MCDPPDQLIQLIRRRIDIITGRDDQIYFWQCATFQDTLTREFREQVVDLARERQEQMSKVLERVRLEGSADSETALDDI